MKKKLALCSILGCMTAAVLGGCGTKAAATPDTSKETAVSETLEESTSNEEELPLDTENQSDNKAIENTEVKTEEDITTKEADAESKPTGTADSNADSFPILGQKNIENYDGFKYLHCIHLTSSDTTDAVVPVYVPSEEVEAYDFYYDSSHGVTCSVSLEPPIRFDQEDYSTSENLAYYLTDEASIYSYFDEDEYMDLVMGDVKNLDDKTAYATSEYYSFVEYDGTDNYYAHYTTYLLKELDDGVTILVEIEIDSDDVTEETDALIAELETFYQFEINWDAEKAAKKIAALSK